MDVRRRNAEFKSENEFFTDCKDCLWAHALRHMYGWPRRDLLAQALDAFDGKLSVGFRELEATNMFRSHHGIKMFLQHYQRISQVWLSHAVHSL